LGSALGLVPQPEAQSIGAMPIKAIKAQMTTFRRALLVSTWLLLMIGLGSSNQGEFDARNLPSFFGFS
jgi:hypothetical protein